MSTDRNDIRDTDIAIVGMACRVPGASDPTAYWRNLRDGVESIVDLDEARLRAAGVSEADLTDPAYVRRAALLDGYDTFDARFFGFTPKDAAILDPQHRHFLEVCWEALESAGYPPGAFEGRVGVFAGSGMHAYFARNLLPNRRLMDDVGLFLVRHTGNDKDFLATRVSYELDLTGPSVNVQTACSTSLVSVHMGCQSLIAFESDLVLAGGVTIELPHERGYRFESGEILAPDGHCRPFDARSGGTLFGSGAGVLVLRRASEALEAGDTIHAIIRGSAINNDGALKVGYLAPSVDGQAAAIAEALEIADVPPATVRFVEAHGTATPVGDPIEITALTQAYGRDGAAAGSCVVGSVKSNIGHLDTAAGAASLIKAVEAVKHGQIPPTLHYQAPNPAIDFAASPFYVNADLIPWPDDPFPRRAGVSSLGVGGTNAHVVIQEAPDPLETTPSRAHQLLVLSARSDAARERAAARLAAHLGAEDTAPTELADVAYTLHLGRQAMTSRLALVVGPGADPAAALGAGDGARRATAPSEPRELAFLFAGGGAQYPEMGRGLYESEPAYRDALDEALAALPSDLTEPVRALLFLPEGADEAALAAAHAELRRPSRALPALLATQYAQARLWMSWGVTPSAMLGHSMGEYTAACLAGVFTLAEALALVATRGRLFETLPEGGMLSVFLPRDEVEPLLGERLSLAATNAPAINLASGPVDAIEALQAELDARGVSNTRVHIEVAAHSAMLDPILEPFEAFVRTVRLRPPQIPIVSNVTGDWLRDAEATDPTYWVRHLRGTVRFAEGAARLLEDPARALLEVGPGRTLATLSRMNVPAGGAAPPILSSMRHPEATSHDQAFQLGVLGELWCHGADVDWAAFYGDEVRRRVPLPTYPFEHERYWIAEAERAADPLARKPASQWYYLPAWRRRPLLRAADVAPDGAPGDGVAVLLAPPDPTLSAALAEGLRTVARRVVVLDGERASAPFAGLAAAARRGTVTHVVHALAVGASDVTGARVHGFESLLALGQALARLDWSHAVELRVLTSGLQDILGAGPENPGMALLLGPASVMPREIPHLRCGVVDVPRPSDTEGARRVAAQVVAELAQGGAANALDEVVAYVGASRWVRAFEPTELPELAPPPRAGAVYLVTGGLGGIGLAVAQRLARPGVTLSLIGRTAPNRFQRDALEALRESGAEVIFDAVDVCDGARLGDHVAHLRATRGRVDGVVHAAGVIDDALMALKSVEAARRVLAPKVDGTLALMRALGPEPLDFMLLFSSVSAFGGLAGQADYAAANAFLDAFASQQRAHGRPVTAVAWPAWREVGMAAELAAPDLDAGAVGAGARPCAHPLLDRLVASTPSGRIYETDFSVARHWLLDEHRIRDAGALIPGTGFMELARAALLEGDEAQPVSLWDVGFESPFDVADDETRTLRITLRYRGRRTELVMQSAHPAGGVVEHLRGELELGGPGGIAAPAPVDLEAVRARCTRGASERPGEEHEAHLALGPRWANLTRLELGAGEALVTLALRGDAAEDAGDYGLHPALLDMATASAQSLVEGFEPARDFYVPLGYRALHWYAPLGTELFSHIRLRLHGGSGGAGGAGSGGAGSDGLAVFDATLCDGEGTVLAEVSELTMRRVDRAALVANLAEARQTPAREAASSRGVDPALQRALALGLAPDEALGALERVLAQAGSEGLSAVAIVPQDLTATLRALRGEADPDETPADDAEDAPDAEGFVAPEGALETRIAAIWAEALGIRHVSADADFFALGGHSLVAIRITSRLNQAFGVDLPLRAIFDSPTVRGLGAELSPLLGERAEVASGGFSAAREIPRAEPAADGTFAPSAAQESLWFLDQLQPGNPAYNIALALDLRGALDVAALQVALDSVVERHAILRTRFVSAGGAPRVVVDPPAPLALEREPLAESARGDAGEVSERVRNWIDRQAARPFDLSRGPLLRAALLEAGPEHHVLSVTMHHIASDEWSLEAFYDELAERYESEVVGRPAALPELSIQYLDFAAWQRAQLEESDLSELFAYWREELAGVPGHIELPTDHPRPPTQRFDGARAVHVVDPDVARRVRALCAERGVTSFVALLAAFQTLLYRLSGQADVVVGSPSSSRSREETERLIGFFVNTLVLRGRFEDDPSFAELLEATRATVYGAFEHQRLPFDRLVRSLDLPRDPSRNPLFQVLFAVYPSVQHVDLHGLEVTRLHPDHGGAQVDLSLYVEDGDEAMRCIFEYNSALFDRATVDAVHARFERLLRGIVEAPERRVSELPILPEPERRRLLVEWNDTAAPYDRAACVHELVFREAERNPNAVAVEAGGQSLRYGELAAAARALAVRLQRAGAGPGEIVGIYVERSLDMVVGLLGILASGAAYLPLDPEFPAERLAFMLEDSGARALLTQRALADALPAHECPVLYVDEPDESELLGESGEAAATPQPTPGDRAYVIYTSGSTGKPKGVQVHHGAVVNFLTSMAADPGLTHKDSLLAVTTIAFDISVLEVFLPLMVGARLVVATRDEVSDGGALRERLEASKATVMQATPTTWRLLFQAGWKRSKLRVLCGGEAMPRDLARQLVLNAGAVWNMYGPTETTIWSTLHPVEGRDPDVRIGRPIANTQVYVLDEHRQPVPIGVYGELYIGGDGVTLGYVGRPELTAERFLPDPFAGGSGEAEGGSGSPRMYRTGDRVRFRRDGTLEYLERIDNQVKVRGFRIELGEIEARLEALETVARAVVSAHTFGPGDTRLVGYVIAAPGADFDVEATREALRATLPEYMVPAMWERLAAFPLTANNKVDRKALPVPGAHAAARVVQPPETETERTLAAIWERTLGVSGVGLQDNFFDLGGHSLLAMTAIWEIERATGHRLNPMELSVQTLMQVAAACENAHAAQRRAGQETPSDGEAAVRGPATTPAGADAPRDGAHAGTGGRPLLRRALGSLKRRVLGD